MFKRAEIRQNLLGCLETALFMRSGVTRFCPGKRSMVKSFLIPFLVLPLTLVTVLAAHPHSDLSTGTANILIAVYSLRLVVYLGLFVGFIYFMAKNMDRLEHFYRFVTANNWLSLPAATLMLPLVALFMSGQYGWSEIYPLMVFVTLYSYAYTAFMATYVMRIPMELACFIAIAGMAIHQTSLDVLKWVAVNTAYLIS